MIPKDIKVNEPYSDLDDSFVYTEASLDKVLEELGMARMPRVIHLSINSMKIRLDSSNI